MKDGALHPGRATAQFSLLGCIFLGLFTEVLLSPYYPQFFRQVFGIEHYGFTGLYLFVCRLTVLLFSPLWGWLSRKVEVKRLLFAGQLGTAAATALLATAGQPETFLLLTILLLMFKSSYMLMYPMLMELGGVGGQAASAARFHAVHHAAMLLAALGGAHILRLEEPLSLFYVAAAADVVQLLICVWALRGWNALLPRQPEKSDRLPLRQLLHNRHVLRIGLLFLTLVMANQIVRPYFTPYVEMAFGMSTTAAGMLFLLPHALALLLLPFLRILSSSGRLGLLYGLGLSAMAVGLILQSVASGLALLIIGRMLYGLFLAVTMAVLDILLFERQRSTGAVMAFSMIVSFQTAGELAAPLLSSTLVQLFDLHVPLVAAAVLCICNIAIFAGTGSSAVRKEDHAWNSHGSKV
jgi:MFS transporter, DHA1 family, multidrug resistance protein